MLEIFAIVAAILLIAIAAVLVLAALKPDTFRIQRTARIDAPPERIFPLISDFDNWGKWSPYEKKDPAMKRTRSGPASGKGAIYAWEGDKNVGKGRMEIAEATPSSKVALKLEFERPFACRNVVDFTLQRQGGGTQVTWAMEGPVPYAAKIMHVIFNIDRMCGKDFEAGLASMKAVAEAQATAEAVRGQYSREVAG